MTDCCISFVSSGTYLVLSMMDSAVCGFVSYFMYKDYFSGKEMIALLCAL